MEWIIPALLTLSLTIGAVLLYCIPLRLRLSFSTTDTHPHGSATVTCGITGIRVNLIPGEVQAEILLLNSVLIRPHITGSGFGSRDDDSFFSQLKTPGAIQWISRIPGWISRIISHGTIEKITGRIRFGSGDPMLTGLLYGIYRAVIPLVPERCSFWFCPVFERAECTGECDLQFCIRRPLDILVPAGADVLSLILAEKVSFVPPGMTGADRA
ncbi:MAG: DUF2953 domain-containing protein [Methanospirillaceae archaeon]|nr:DUF2953 domain-containing protein [Methanospirillaceae archaeon]